jgi:hypothetical protein
VSGLVIYLVAFGLLIGLEGLLRRIAPVPDHDAIGGV